ncbi:MAG: hypothetical protein JWM44_2565 [Bacilli bacterium]|nr:hypothetical protein [Bacilli bacterium]
MRAFYKKFFPIFLIFALITTIIAPLQTSADHALMDVQKQAAASSSLGTIAVAGNTYFELEKVNAMPSEGKGTNISFIVSLHNNEDHDLFLRDYWIYMQIGANSQIPVHLTSGDKLKNRVSSGTTERFTFYAVSNGNVKPQDITFKFIKWDFNIPGFEQPLGTISVPSNYSDTPLANKGIQSIDITGISVSTSVYQAQYSDNGKNVLTMVSFELVNEGNSQVAIPDYQFYIQTFDGNNYKMIVQDTTNMVIAPLSRKKLMLYAELPSVVDTSAWKLLVTQMDTDSKLMLPIARYELTPTKLENRMTSLNEWQRIEIADTPLNTKITNVFVNGNEENNTLVFNFQIANVGNRSVKIPALAFNLRTKKGILYPAAAMNADNLKIDSGESQDITVSASLPLESGTNGLELLLNDPQSQAANAEYPMAVFKIPREVGKEILTGAEYNFTIHKKTLSAKLNGMNRYPWGQEDELVADIAIGNKENSSVVVPSFIGYFLLDGKIKIDAAGILAENTAALKNNSTTQLMLVGKIPYTSEYSSIQIVLLNKENDKTIIPLAEFTNTADLLEIPNVAANDIYQLTDQGRKMNLKVHNVQTYKGITKNILYVEFEMENQEKRFVNPAALVVYFKTKDDIYFPLQVNPINQQISPSGKALLACWASMPQSYQLKDLELMVGLGISGNNFVSEEVKPDAFVKAVEYMLPAENNSYLMNFTDVSLNSYTFSLNKMIASTGILPDSMDIKFDYKLSNSSSDMYENQISGHKLLFEFVNGSSDTKFISELSFEEGSGNILQTGNHSTTLTFTDTGLMQKLNMFNNYTVNLYDQYQGNKRLIATRSLKWFQPSD